MNNQDKIISKYYRIRNSDRIRKLIESLPIKDLVETQVGNHVYSGSGTILVGLTYRKMSIQIRLIDKNPIVYVKVPEAGIDMNCEMMIASERIREMVRKFVN